MFLLKFLIISLLFAHSFQFNSTKLFVSTNSNDLSKKCSESLINKQNQMIQCQSELSGEFLLRLVTDSVNEANIKKAICCVIPEVKQCIIKSKVIYDEFFRVNSIVAVIPRLLCYFYLSYQFDIFMRNLSILLD